MTLSINQPLIATDILDVRELKDGKIFLLMGRDDSRLVIKAEPQVTGDKIKAAASTLKAIDPCVKMKPLLPAEINALKEFVQNWEKLVATIKSAMKSDHEPVTEKEKQSIAKLKAAIQTYGSASPSGRTDIAKMNFVQMTTLGVVLDVEGTAQDDGSWDEARRTFAKFIKALDKSGGLEKLGQIMAGDFFIGNLDRFSADGSGIGLKLYGETKIKKLKVLFNLNNIILMKEAKGKSTRPSMLDYMDPNTQHLFLDNTLANSPAAADWPMRVLLNSTSRKKIAQDLIDDLNYVLRPERNMFGTSKLGGRNPVGRVDDGIVAGIKAIIKSAEGRRAKLPPLMVSYLDAVKTARL